MITTWSTDRSVRIAVTVLAVTLAMSALPAAAKTGRQPFLASVEPISIMDPFPPHTFTNLNAGAGGPARIDTAAAIGKKPVIIYYWIPRNKRSEDLLVQLQELCDELSSSKIELYTFCMERPGMEADKISARAKDLDLHVPVLSDEGYRIGQQLKIQIVPNITLLDKDGMLKLTNGGSLLQQLEYKIDLGKAIRRLATTGNVGTYGYLPKYSPAQEMVGKKCPDFDAPTIDDGIVRKWSSIMDPNRINVLVFWAIDCGHCRKQLPKINDWFKKNPDGYNIYTAVKITNEVQETRTREFLKIHNLVFPTLKDVDRQVGNKFLITATPTIFIIGPDGVIDSVLLSGGVDFAKKFEARKRALLDSRGS